MFPVIDLHQDLLLHITHPELFSHPHQTSFDAIKKSGIKIVVATAFPVPPRDDFFDVSVNMLIEKDIVEYVLYAAKNSEWIVIKNRSDLERVMGTEGLFGILIHVEGMQVFDEKKGWDMLDRWYELGLRSIGPVWNLTNVFGGGTHDREHGLTKLGVELLQWCEAHSMLCDFAHMNEKTFWDAVKVVQKPILVSHGNARAYCDSPRNYSDEQLRYVGASGGVIGVFMSKRFLSVSPEEIRCDVLDEHIRHVVAVAGTDTVAFGTDFGGITSGFLECMQCVGDVQPFIKHLPIEWREIIAYKNAFRILSTYLS